MGAVIAPAPVFRGRWTPGGLSHARRQDADQGVLIQRNVHPFVLRTVFLQDMIRHLPDLVRRDAELREMHRDADGFKESVKGIDHLIRRLGIGNILPLDLQAKYY